MSTVSYICHQTQADPKFTVICLHGLGSSGHNLAALMPLLNLDNLPFRFIFPNAPLRAVTLNGGYHMPAWYDIYTLDAKAAEDQPGILAAEEQIISLIAEQNAAGIPSRHIFLLGFSQGGALALFTGLRYPQRLAGIIGLSTYLPIPEVLTKSCHTANQEVPIFLAHGHQDAIIQFTTALQIQAWLLKANYPITWSSYEMEHSICPEEIAELARWLQTQIQKISLPD